MKTWPEFFTLPTHKSLLQLSENRENKLGALLKTKDKDLLDLISSLLCWNPVKRLTLAEAAMHPFFSKEPYAVHPKDITSLKYLDHLS